MFKYVLLIVILFLNCDVFIAPSDICRVKTITSYGDHCDYIVSIPGLTGDIELKGYPCNCYKIGDTIVFNVKK